MRKTSILRTIAPRCRIATPKEERKAKYERLIDTGLDVVPNAMQAYDDEREASLNTL